MRSDGQAGVVFSFVDGAAGDQNGHTLSGTIEFSSLCGTLCDASDVVDFDVTVTGSNGFTLNGPPLVTIDINGNGGFLEVDATGVHISYSPVPPGTSDTFRLDGNSNPYVEWSQSNPIGVATDRFYGAGSAGFNS